jgi:hypothetical protein
MHGLKVQIVHAPRQVLGKPESVLDECMVDQQLGSSRGQLDVSSFLNLLLQWHEVPLHPVDTNG